jgi:ABC-2 type transport system ATP-binding protein
MTEPIVISGLEKEFGGFKAVDNLSLKVKRNCFMGFLGPNGAGKSTTIKILTNLLAASGGSAELEGVDVVKDPKRALAHVGAVVETPEFYPYLTPMETLAYLAEIRGMSKSDALKRSHEVLETVKMEEWKDKRIGKFSKGMKQRIALAQAILHEPPIVILDEPTSGLDPRGMFEVREVLRELKRQDYTVFMSSHMLNEVQDTCDEVILINRGQLLRAGTVADLTSSSSLRRLEVRTRVPLAGESQRRISELDGVEGILPTSPQQFSISLKGGDLEQCRLLPQLQQQGLEVLSFREEGVALENLYMSLIKESR